MIFPAADKKVNGKRHKSPFRDAQFRPLFQALAAFADMQTCGETSVICAPSTPTLSIDAPTPLQPVTYSTPSHPSYPLIRLTPETLPSTSLPTSSLTPENLTDREQAHDTRFWRHFAQTLPGLSTHKLPAAWRDLSDEYSLEWFHNALRASSKPFCDFTLQFGDEVLEQLSRQPSSAGWLSKRIARHLKALLGRPVAFWFAFEKGVGERLHVHGELQASPNEFVRVRRALRLAGGQWSHTRQHQAKIKQASPTVVWPQYVATLAPYIQPRPKIGRMASISRPINGDWIFATNEIRIAAGNLYADRRKAAISLMKSLW